MLNPTNTELPTVPRTDPVEVAKELLESGRCLAWIGSGLSIPAGYPNWDNAIRILASCCFGEEKRMEREIAAGRYSAAAEKCKERSKKRESDIYEDTLARLFGRRVVTRRLAYELLLRLPFSGYITTNYDPLLQYEARGTDCCLLSYPGLHAEESDRRPVYYIHGCARQDNTPDAKHLVLADSEYEEAYSDPGIVSGFLVRKLALNHVLFIGTELTDPQLQSALERVGRAIRQISAAGQMAGSPRYCFLQAAAVPQALESDASILRSLGIKEILYYKRGDDRFSGLEDFLEHLCRAVDIELPPPLQSAKSGVGMSRGAK